MGKQTCLDVIIDPRRDVATRRRLFDVWEKKIPAWDAAHGPLSGVMDTLTHTDTTQDGTTKQVHKQTEKSIYNNLCICILLRWKIFHFKQKYQNYILYDCVLTYKVSKR